MSDAPKSTPDFLALLRASGLVPAESLDPLVALYFDEPGPVPEGLRAALLEADLVTDWQLEQIAKGRHRGFTLGKYTLRRLIGAGGMGSVYLARHTALGGDVAIKVLPTKRVGDGSYLERFNREAQAAARLSHPNIARVIDLDTVNSIHFMVMEYVRGIDLHAKVKHDGPMAVAEAVDCIRQAALGLHHAHEQGFVHRDIKPANLMLDIHGTIKVLDLGLAKTRTDDDEAASLTMEFHEKTLGTADFVAPEQAADSHTADRRADIYSLGCTLYYLLVGRAPFAAGSIKDRLKSQLHAKPPNPVEDRPDVPADLAEYYFRLMEKSPAARPQTAKEVADTLQAWLAKHGAPAGTASVQHQRAAVARRDGSGSSVMLRSDLSSRISGISTVDATSDRGSEIIGHSSVIRRSATDLRLPPGAVRPPAGKPRPPAPPRPAAATAPTPAKPGHQPEPRPAPVGTPPRQTGPSPTNISFFKRAAAMFAGLPPAVWIVLTVGLLAIVVLAALVVLPSSG